MGRISIASLNHSYCYVPLENPFGRSSNLNIVCFRIMWADGVRIIIYGFLPVLKLIRTEDAHADAAPIAAVGLVCETL